MNKKQKRSLSSNTNITINTNSKQNLDDNPLLSSDSTNNNKEDLSSSNDITIVNDTVPNWVQSGGQVRERKF
jgi:hypothetical protein